MNKIFGPTKTFSKTHLHHTRNDHVVENIYRTQNNNAGTTSLEIKTAMSKSSWLLSFVVVINYSTQLTEIHNNICRLKNIWRQRHKIYIPQYMKPYFLNDIYIPKENSSCKTSSVPRTRLLNNKLTMTYIQAFFRHYPDFFVSPEFLRLWKISRPFGTPRK